MKVSDLRISKPEVLVGRYWIEVEYRVDGVLHIDQISDVTEHAVLCKAQARANKILDGGK